MFIVYLYKLWKLSEKSWTQGDTLLIRDYEIPVIIKTLKSYVVLVELSCVSRFGIRISRTKRFRPLPSRSDLKIIYRVVTTASPATTSRRNSWWQDSVGKIHYLIEERIRRSYHDLFYWGNLLDSFESEFIRDISRHNSTFRDNLFRRNLIGVVLSNTVEGRKSGGTESFRGLWGSVHWRWVHWSPSLPTKTSLFGVDGYRWFFFTFTKSVCAVDRLTEKLSLSRSELDEWG